MVRNKQRSARPVIRHVVVNHSDIMNGNEEPVDWLTEASAPEETPVNLRLLKPPPPYAEKCTSTKRNSHKATPKTTGQSTSKL